MWICINQIQLDSVVDRDFPSVQWNLVRNLQVGPYEKGVLTTNRVSFSSYDFSAVVKEAVHITVSGISPSRHSLV
jgi:hypothetical protein